MNRIFSVFYVGRRVKIKIKILKGDTNIIFGGQIYINYIL
jgi:hypothetical protein